jgi:UDP-N-acetylmuramoyl-L-alanyl-D-glutamate--2,6-diaminopimelate ligase
MKLSECVGSDVQLQHDDPIISALALDSRDVQPQSLFFAMPGLIHDGRNYIADAFAKGAAVVLYDPLPFFYEEQKLLAQYSGKMFPLLALQNKVGMIASRFYQNPSQALRIFAVTGTNGKTSTCYFLASLLRALNHTCGMIGTVGMGTAEWFTKAAHTTPDAITIQKVLRRFEDEECEYVAMEASSHALVQGRLFGTTIKTALFTNLTRDHLDYHQTLANYQNAKASLFQFPGLECAVINLDDDFGLQLYTKLQSKLPCYGYTLHPEKVPEMAIHFAYATDVQLSAKGIRAQIHTTWGDGLLETPLLGRFNLSNLLGVIAALVHEGFALADLLRLLKQPPIVPGRMQRFGSEQQPTVIVDFAHTPDALEQALITLRDHCHGELWCVFGCGGDRDRGKRPQMGAISERYSDHIVLTDDNPRDEVSATIINEIVSGIHKPDRVTILADRQQAIRFAIQHATSADIILIAGKGHEIFQQIGDKQYPFSDSDEVSHALAHYQSSIIE